MFDDALYDDITDNPTLESIARIAGTEAAAQISIDFGGIRLHIPVSLGVHSPLAVSIGLDAAQKIAQIYGGMHLDVPLNPGKRARIIAMDAEGYSAPVIARKVGCTERLVYKVRAEQAEKNQMTLPLQST
jgi:hypothetical protein